jgi:hypothetical protein
MAQMHLSRPIRWLVVTLAVLLGLSLGFYYFILDWHDKPFCHKQVMLVIQSWMDANGMRSTTLNNPFPNVGGVGQDSLAEIHTEMGEDMAWAQDYRYVPGLRQDDPGDLVLMYFNRPTRWTMHIAPPTIFSAREWILIPVDFTFFGSRTASGPGEMSERVSADEFKTRLKKTIDYIRKKQRPNWPTIVAEQTKFLESIDSPDR